MDRIYQIQESSAFRIIYRMDRLHLLIEQQLAFAGYQLETTNTILVVKVPIEKPHGVSSKQIALTSNDNPP